MTPEKLESHIWGWFEDHYPGNPAAECHVAVPAELRAVIFTGLVEGEISNGGLPQLLWNTFHHWQAVLDDAEMGYRLFGATRHQDGIRQFRTLFANFEHECQRYMEQSTCGEWCRHGYTVMKSEHEDLFFSDQGRQRRHAWILANMDR